MITAIVSTPISAPCKGIQGICSSACAIVDIWTFTFIIGTPVPQIDIAHIFMIQVGQATAYVYMPELALPQSFVETIIVAGDTAEHVITTTFFSIHSIPGRSYFIGVFATLCCHGPYPEPSSARGFKATKIYTSNRKFATKEFSASSIDRAQNG